MNETFKQSWTTQFPGFMRVNSTMILSHFEPLACGPHVFIIESINSYGLVISQKKTYSRNLTVIQ